MAKLTILGVAIAMCVIVNITNASTPEDHGAKWRSMAVMERYQFVRGIRSGAILVLSEYVGKTGEGSGEVVERLKRAALGSSNPPAGKIASVMDHLYNDPANANIDHSSMYRIARDKIEGEDVEEALRHARRFALVMSGEMPAESSSAGVQK